MSNMLLVAYSHPQSKRSAVSHISQIHRIQPIPNRSAVSHTSHTTSPASPVHVSGTQVEEYILNVIEIKKNGDYDVDETINVPT